jgi:hypothetical protein
MKATALSMARARNRFGNIGSIVRNTLSSPRNRANQPRLWCGALAVIPIECGACRNSSSMPMPMAFFARGFSAASTSNGTIVVRAQYEILLR